MLQFDHIAITAASLDEGLEWVRDRLDITVPTGGAHPRMGTHNRLMRLGRDEFLEIIAIDPEAPAPAHPRWFDLDHREGPPGIGNWILRCNDLDTALARFPEAGPAIEMTRDALQWRIGAPADGRLPLQGALPTLIEWPMRPFPGAAMADFGCRLGALTIHHPDAERIAARLSPYLADPRIRFVVGEFSISAIIETPAGARVLA